MEHSDLESSHNPQMPPIPSEIPLQPSNPNPQVKQNSKEQPTNQKYQKFKEILGDIFSKLDFFKATTSLCFEGKPTSSSAFGGFITIIVFMFAFYMSGWPFKDSYISSVNLMDDIIYNYTATEHPLAINITLPPDAPPLLDNITFQLGCSYSKSDSLLYMFQAYAEPCALGDYCAPPSFECPLYTSLDKQVSSLKFNIYLCQSQFATDCDTSIIQNLDYINITVGYYSDQVSFVEPTFNRYFITRNISIPMRNSGSIQQELEINFFNTNTYFRGIFGFDSIKLSSLRYSESYSTLTVLQPSFMGLSEGDSLFSYSLTTKQSSKQITHHFPNINSWISEVVSFTSIVTILIGFFFGYYETNIMLLKLMSYLKYGIEPNGKPTNFREESLKTILAGYLYHKWILWLLPNCVLNYFHNHFLALEEGERIIKLEYVLNAVAKIKLDENKIYKVDLDDLDKQQEGKEEENQQDVDYTSNKIEKRIKGYIKDKYEFLVNETQQEVFLNFIKIQGYNYKQSVKSFEIVFGEERYESDREYEHLRNEYYVFREEAYPHYVNEVYFMDQEDIKPREYVGESNQNIVINNRNEAQEEEII